MAVVVAAKRRTRERLQKRAAALVRLHAADEATRLGVSASRRPATPAGRSGRLDIRLGRGGACRPPQLGPWWVAPCPFPRFTRIPTPACRPPCTHRAVYPELYCVHATRPVRRRPVLRHAAATQVGCRRARSPGPAAAAGYASGHGPVPDQRVRVGAGAVRLLPPAAASCRLRAPKPSGSTCGPCALRSSARTGDSSRGTTRPSKPSPRRLARVSVRPSSPRRGWLASCCGTSGRPRLWL